MVSDLSSTPAISEELSRGGRKLSRGGSAGVLRYIPVAAQRTHTCEDMRRVWQMAECLKSMAAPHPSCCKRPIPSRELERRV
eukprot:6552-Eustigmatos_ZCMA.PRE.1